MKKKAHEQITYYKNIKGFKSKRKKIKKEKNDRARVGFTLSDLDYNRFQ